MLDVCVRRNLLRNLSFLVCQQFQRFCRWFWSRKTSIDWIYSLPYWLHWSKDKILVQAIGMTRVRPKPSGITVQSIQNVNQSKEFDLLVKRLVGKWQVYLTRADMLLFRMRYSLVQLKFEMMPNDHQRLYCQHNCRIESKWKYSGGSCESREFEGQVKFEARLHYRAFW